MGIPIITTFQQTWRSLFLVTFPTLYKNQIPGQTKAHRLKMTETNVKNTVNYVMYVIYLRIVTSVPIFTGKKNHVRMPSSRLQKSAGSMA